MQWRYRIINDSLLVIQLDSRSDWDCRGWLVDRSSGGAGHEPGGPCQLFTATATMPLKGKVKGENQSNWWHFYSLSERARKYVHLHFLFNVSRNMFQTIGMVVILRNHYCSCNPAPSCCAYLYLLQAFSLAIPSFDR